MPKDALTIYRAAEELDMLIGGRVDKVTMPSNDTVILLFHTKNNGNHRLLLSCNPSLPRAHITAAQYRNPEVASGTLMYFRKRLTGAVLTAVERDKCERMIGLEFSALDELRERIGYSLKVELTGKCANIVFVEQSGVIGLSLRRVYAEVEGKRAVFAGLEYELPAPTGRVGIFDATELKARIAALSGMSARAAFDKCVAGLASTTVTELFFGLGIPDSAPPSDDIIDAVIAEAENLYSCPLRPVATFDGSGKPMDYFAVPYRSCGGNAVPYPTLNAAMDAYYSALFAAADLQAYLKPLRAAVKTAIAKNKKRLAEALDKLASAESAESERILGDLITANIYKIKRGDTSVTVENYYDDNAPVTIALDVAKTPAQNAAAHYKTYNKSKRAAVYAREACDKAQAMLHLLDGIALELELCTEKTELDEVRAELVALGLVKPENRRLKQKPIPSEPYRFVIEGAVLLIGKNHAQNDRITRAAARTDTWLHVKDAHGSHAVLKTPAPSESQIRRAAELAAYYSAARLSEHVPVDYTLVKFVYPHGGGKVDYKEYKTVFVTPPTSLEKK